MSKSFCPIRYTWGKEKEVLLKSRIESNIKEPITLILNTTDTKDYVSDTYFLELKSRRFYDSNQYSDWLVPQSKFKDKQKKIVIYYHWQKDDTLFRYNYSPETLATCKLDKGPISDQLHYYIPKHYFTQVTS